MIFYNPVWAIWKLCHNGVDEIYNQYFKLFRVGWCEITIDNYYSKLFGIKIQYRHEEEIT